jgi:hypothetical protein
MKPEDMIDIEEDSRQLVQRLRPVQPDRQSSIIPAPGTALVHCPSNIDATTLKGKAMLLKASAPGNTEIDVPGGVRIDATHWIVIPDYRVDEASGEIKQFTRTVLFGKGGLVFRTTSAHFPMRIAELCKMFAEEDWQRGIPLIICERKSKRNTTYHDVSIFTDE